MKSTPRTFILLVAAALAFAVLAGCEPGGEETTWVYDFTTDGDAIEDSAWFVDAGWMGEYPSGYWLNQASIAAPYLFTGEFVAEFEFYLKFVDDDYILSYAFRLVDQNWDTASQRYFSFAAYYTAFPPHDDRYYTVSQGDGDDTYQDYWSSVPGIRSGANTCRLVKTGSTIKIYMNDTYVDTETIDAANQPSVGYAPLIRGHNSWVEGDTNFYIRKLTVTYQAGERVDHDWNP